jgi:SagB-type dehydrogenase family enzyme
MSQASTAQPFIISIAGQSLATIVPFGTDRVTPISPSASQSYTLSRFAYFHRQDEQMILESPLAHTQVVLNDWRATAILYALAKPKTLGQLCNEIPDLPKDSIVNFLSWLLGSAFLAVTDEDGAVKEDPSLSLWEFHDLLFHTRSRMGRHHYPYGRSDSYPSKIKPLSAVKPLMSSQVIPLYQPDIDILIEQDISLTQALEGRRSLRQHGESPLTIQQLGEFLYRTARIRTLKTTESVAYEFSDRPYPSGGACYELELYGVVNTCQGLESGIYHYCPQNHVLCQLQGYTSNVFKLTCHAATSNGLPHLLIIITARFPRITWKYRSIAYALTLKHVGVLYQSMYLVATAMGLAPCAVGGGNSDLFAQTIGTKYYEETSVGEFILGSKTS